jgi:hypothetical protein
MDSTVLTVSTIQVHMEGLLTMEEWSAVIGRFETSHSFLIKKSIVFGLVSLLCTLGTSFFEGGGNVTSTHVTSGDYGPLAKGLA